MIITLVLPTCLNNYRRYFILYYQFFFRKMLMLHIAHNHIRHLRFTEINSLTYMIFFLPSHPNVHNTIYIHIFFMRLNLSVGVTFFYKKKEYR